MKEGRAIARPSRHLKGAHRSIGQEEEIVDVCDDGELPNN